MEINDVKFFLNNIYNNLPSGHDNKPTKGSIIDLITEFKNYQVSFIVTNVCYLNVGIRPWIPMAAKTVPLSTFKQDSSSKKIKIKYSLHSFLCPMPMSYLLILYTCTQSLHVKHCSRQ